MAAPRLGKIGNRSSQKRLLRAAVAEARRKSKAARKPDHRESKQPPRG
jgi:hypothetical protein